MPSFPSSSQEKRLVLLSLLPTPPLFPRLTLMCRVVPSVADLDRTVPHHPCLHRADPAGQGVHGQPIGLPDQALCDCTQPLLDDTIAVHDGGDSPRSL